MSTCRRLLLGLCILASANSTFAQEDPGPDQGRGPDAELIEYCFGNLDARRVTRYRGRDVVLDPEPRAGRLNALPKAQVKVDGRSLAEKAGWTRKLTFVEKGK